MKSNSGQFLLLFFSFITILTIVNGSCKNPNDVFYDDEEDSFIPPGMVYQIPDNFKLPENIRTNPVPFDAESFMMEGKIMYGKLAKARAFPHQVLVLSYAPNRTVNVCGGSILSENWILTAGHCTYQSYYLSIGVGSNKFKGLTFHNTSYFITHPLYNPTTLQHDVAMIKLCKGLVFNEYVRAIRLPDAEYKCEDFTGYTATISGFGITEKNLTVTTEGLRYTSVKIIPNIICMESYQYMITPFIICSEGNNDKSGACMGDSGGPLTILDKKGNFPIQIGIVSFGNPDCESTPSAFTRIGPYLSWIKGYLHDITKI